MRRRPRRADRVLCSRQGAPGMFEKRLARSRQTYSTRVSLQELCPHLLLERVQVATQGGLRDSEAPRSPYDILLFCNYYEVVQALEIHPGSGREGAELCYAGTIWLIKQQGIGRAVACNPNVRCTR